MTPDTPQKQKEKPNMEAKPLVIEEMHAEAPPKQIVTVPEPIFKESDFVMTDSMFVFLNKKIYFVLFLVQRQLSCMIIDIKRQLYVWNIRFMLGL